MIRRCTVCGEESNSAVAMFCHRDLTPEINELLEITLPAGFVTCPGVIEEMYA
jgi:hypothetical protein